LKARHIVENHGHAERIALGVADRQDPRRKNALGAAQMEGNRPIERFGQERPLRADGVGQRLPQASGGCQGGASPSPGATPRMRVATGLPSRRALGIDDHDRIGECVDGRLACALARTSRADADWRYARSCSVMR